MQLGESVLSFGDVVQIGDARRPRCDVTVSLDAVVSYVAPSRIVQAPYPSQRRFGCLSVYRPDAPCASGADARSSVVVCSADDALSALARSDEDALLLVLAGPDAHLDGEWLKRNRNRLVVAAIDAPFEQEAVGAQARFLDVVLWQNEMNTVLSSRGSLGELLDAGSRLLGRFLFVSDTGFNVVAHSSRVNAPSEAFEAIVERGCYTADEMRRIDEEVYAKAAGRTSVVFEAPAATGASSKAHLTVFFDGELYFHIVMVCGSAPIDAASKSLFMAFCERAVALCEGFWQDKMRVHSPWHKVLTNLIENVPMSPSYIDLQLERTEIPRSSQFKLVCVDLKSCSSVVEKNRIVAAARGLNEGNVYPFMYYGLLLVLYFTPSSSDACFSARSMYADLEEAVFRPFGVRATSSATFYDIHMMRAAYIQAKYTYRILSVIDREKRLADVPAQEALTPFEDAVPYYVCADQGYSSTMKGFDFNQGMIRKIAAEDRDLGTDVVRLLWLYLCCECNATTVAKKLHMHRNTVLYHISKIEKKFDVDFSDYRVRNRAVFDIRMLLAGQGRESGLHVDGSELMPDHDEERQIR